MAISTRSRTICSTSRPTYPTSVNLVASTLRNGAPASLASRREISVLPTPVGPIIKMFFGITSSRIWPCSCWRRQRLRSAIATARLASFWPMMKRSSSETISRGEKSVMTDVFGPCRGLLQWRGSLPHLDCLDRVDHHQNVEREIIVDQNAQRDFDDRCEGDHAPRRQQERERKSEYHRNVVADRVDNAVAEIVERNSLGAIAGDDQVAIFG